MSDRLTQEKIEEIRKRAEDADGNILEDVRVMAARDMLAREDIPALLAEVERLQEVLTDLANYGTRHDITPTIGGRIQSCVDVSGFYEYMRSMDESVRRRAKEALRNDGEG
ncbi:hypothetical protein [Sporosarcina sp. ITBMC105]